MKVRRKQILMSEMKRTDQRVGIRLHQNSIIGSFSVVSHAAADDLNGYMHKKLKTLADWVITKQGIIGHIKASVEQPGLVTMYSITDSEVSRKEGADNSIQVSITMIVFFVNKEEVQKQLEICLEEIQALEKYTDESKEQSL